MKKEFFKIIVFLLTVLCLTGCTSQYVDSDVIENDDTTSLNSENTYTVTFKDENDNVIEVENVEKGESAEPPEPPKKEGYYFVSWDYDTENIKCDLEVKPVFKKISSPTFYVNSVTVENEKKFTVTIDIYNNPGLLGLLLNLKYDDTVMELYKIENGSVFSKYNFTPAKNMMSDCNFAWNITDVPDDTEQGELLTLYFKINEKAKPGKYPISVSSLNNAIDENYNYIQFDTIDGFVNIK